VRTRDRKSPGSVLLPEVKRALVVLANKGIATQAVADRDFSPTG
jgi:hypothetical protein